LRRVTFPWHFAPELLTTSLVMIGAAGLAAPVFGLSVLESVVSAAVFWYAWEAFLALISGWPLSWRSPFAWMVRDVFLPILWCRAWTSDSFVWRGNAMSVDEPTLGEAAVGPPPKSQSAVR
jgi:ceramide glucosyltransferase